MLNSTPAATVSSVVSAAAQPLGGLLAFGLGICGFAVPALHGLGVPLSTALIIAGLGVYHITVNAPSKTA